MLIDGILGLILSIFTLSIIVFMTKLSIVLGNWFLPKLQNNFSYFIIGITVGILVIHSWLTSRPIWVFVLICVGSCAIFGASIAILSAANFKTAHKKKKLSIYFLTIASLSSVSAFIYWGAHPGSDRHLLPSTEMELKVAPKAFKENPGTMGNLAYKSLSYGNKNDRRELFSKHATIHTQSVNGKAFLKQLKGWKAAIRNHYWGYDRTQLPLNAQVWYPQSEGKYPLVLMVHGNHGMRDYSDPGYAYLGKLMASRGYIFASVDENFLNSDWSARHKKENDARAWILLEHLKLWREWEKDESNPFFNKVDMDNISLIGHSRGGEAVAVAAAFNGLSRYPDDANVQFDYGFGIRSIVAVSPVDGQYKPSNIPTPLANINYLLLHGSHDADLTVFYGDRQYKRIQFDSDTYNFKSSLYIYRANHGQFNTVWENRDTSKLPKYLLNIKPLLTGEQQRQIAKTYISAFLDVTLKNKKQYLPIFKDYRILGNWLPDTLYINRFEDTSTNIIVDFDDDLDVSTTNLKGGKLMAKGFDMWREKDLGARRTKKYKLNQVVQLGWKPPKEKNKKLDGRSDSALQEQKESPIFQVDLPDQFSKLNDISADSILTFSIAEIDNKKYKGDSDHPLDFSIELYDRQNEMTSIKLSSIKNLHPPLIAKIWRTDTMEKRVGKSSETVLQTIEIPLDRFVKANSLFKPTQLNSIRFHFNQREIGMIVLDEIGFR